MSQKYIGGYITDATTIVYPASGDPQFNYVTALLHGDGTNAAQNNTFLDSSTNNFTITRNGNTTQGSFSPFGSLWSNYFNGSSAYLNWTGANCNSGTWTLEAWIFPTANGGGSYGGRGIICCGDVYLNMGFDSSNHITLRWYTGSAGYSISSTTALTLNTWYHVAVTFQSSTSAKVFVNGVMEASTTSNLTLGSATDWYIGREGAQASYFPGYISNARASTSILYSSNFTPSTTPLTVGASTNVLTCQSNRFVDNSTNAYSLTVTAATVQRFSGFNNLTAYSTSVIGGSAYFDGSGDYLTAPANSAYAFGSGDFTVECWVYPTTSLTNQNIVATALTTSGTQWSLTSYSTNKIRFTTYFTNTVLGTIAMNLNSWNHIAASRASGTLRLYVNGVLDNSGTDSNVYTNVDVLGIGYAGDAYFPGYISNVRVIKGTALYTAAFTPPTAPLTAVTNTVFLANNINAGIYDNAMMNDFETVGNAQISTSVYKYGTGSLYFDGSGDQLTRASSPLYSFGTGDFTVEMWVNTSSTANMCLIDARPTGVAEPWAIYTTATTSYPYFYDGSSRTSSIALTLNTWVHVAVCRASGTLRIFVGGVQGYSAANTTNLTSGAIQIGGAFSGAYLTGYIDDLRITSGYARYTSAFTPPTAALPNSYTPSSSVSILPTATAAPGIWTLEQQAYYKAQSLWPAAPLLVQYLVVAGGGGGGGSNGGGGGAGGLKTATGFSVTKGSALTVTVGAGGTGGKYSTSNGTNGSDSVFSTITSTGGGVGGTETGPEAGGNGGSGGGGNGYGTTTGTKAGGTGVSGQGFAGGTGGNRLTGYPSGGGGGSSAVGQDYASGQSGAGGAGTASSITGTSVTYAGGGGGGAYTASAGAGGSGGGGAGSTNNVAGNAGTANTGGGGGGGGNSSVLSGGAGGSGVVIISSPVAAASTTGSPTVTTSGGNTIYTFTSSGTITF